MTDLSKALKVESLDEASYENDKHVRTNAIASLPSSSPAEKSLHRQMVDNNLARNSLETILRHVNTINPSPGDAENIFNANKKKKLQEDLRAALLQNYECKAFLKVAKQYGYQAADEFKEGNRADDNAESEEMKKRMEEIRKNYASSVKPPTRQPMKQQQSYKQSQYQDSFSHGNLYTGQIPQLQVPQPPALPMFHGGYPVAFQGAPAPLLNSVIQASPSTADQGDGSPSRPSTSLTAAARAAMVRVTGREIWNVL